jgi:MFS family permease
MALYGSSGGVGALIGPITTPYLVHGNDYTWYFIFSGTSVLISAIAMVFLVRETLPEEVKAKVRLSWEKAQLRWLHQVCKGSWLHRCCIPARDPPLQNRIYDDRLLPQPLLT